MSGDEIFVLLVSLALGGWLMVRWALVAAGACTLHSSSRVLRVPCAAAALGFAALGVVLGRAASFDVQGIYVFFYLAIGVAWTGLSLAALHVFGLSLRDDLLERHNRAVAPAFAGAIPGLTLCFAGANIGDGPGWWVVIFCAALATGAFLLAWVLLDRVTGVGEEITVHRNAAAGWRAGWWMLALGALLGRAVAGDWVSVPATLQDFGFATKGATVLLVTGLVLEIWAQRRERSGHAPLALVPAWVYVGYTILYLAWLGRW